MHPSFEATVPGCRPPRGAEEERLPPLRRISSPPAPAAGPVCLQARATILILALGTLLAGCASTPAGPAVGGTQPAPISYREVAERFDRNITGLDQVWSRCVAVADWTQDGKPRSEQGEGNLLAILPDRLALSIGKLGQTIIWAGCNQEHYWLFDLKDDGGVVYFGRQGKTAKPGAQPLPVGISPRDVIKLLGVMPIDPNQPPAKQPEVEWVDGGWLIQPPGNGLSPTSPAAGPGSEGPSGIKLLIDPVTFLPRQVHLCDATGKTILLARLSNFKRVRVAGKPPGAWPWMASRYRIEDLVKHSRLTLDLNDLSDGRPDRMHTRAFKLGVLIKALHPARVVDMDNP